MTSSRSQRCTDGGTWRDLQNAMREGPWHILHFIGHGGFDSNRGVSVLAFERDGGGNYRPIEPGTIVLVAEKATLSAMKSDNVKDGETVFQGTFLPWRRSRRLRYRSCQGAVAPRPLAARRR